MVAQASWFCPDPLRWDGLWDDGRVVGFARHWAVQESGFGKEDRLVDDAEGQPDERI